MASHLLSHQSNIETTRRRNMVRKVLLESLERREMMAADLLSFDNDSSVSSLTRSVLSEAELTYSSLNPNLRGYDITSVLDSTFGGTGGSLTERPWFGLIEKSYSDWSQENGLAFSYTSELQAEGESGRLEAEGEVGGPKLLSVAPNSTSIFTFNGVNTLTEAPTELTLRFSDFIDTTDLSGIQLRSAGADKTLGTADDSAITPGWIGAGDNSRIITMRFASALADGLYRVQLASTGANAVRSMASNGNPSKTLEARQFDTTSTDLTLDTVDFRLELGAKVLGVVPQPVDRLADGTLSPQLNKIRVYFNTDLLDAASATNVNFYQLIHTNDLVGPQNHTRFIPQSAVYFPPTTALPQQSMVELTFANPIQSLPGTYRLRIGGSDEVNSSTNLPSITTVAETIEVPGTANTASPNLGVLNGSATFIRTGNIITTTSTVLPLDFPGSNLEPGHRDIQDEGHVGLGTQDSSPRISKISYNFALNRSYGTNAAGQAVFTSITPEQQQRVREIFEFYSRQLGVDFQETEAAGLTIVVGDLFPINGAQSGAGGTRGLFDTMAGLAILDGAEVWDNKFGADFLEESMRQIGFLLGYGNTGDLPSGTIMGNRADLVPGVTNTEWAFPGDHDVVHGKYLFRPDNKDVDTYQFTVRAGQAGKLNIEAMAQRLATSSQLDTHITVFQQTASGPKVIATNDNSFGNDSFVSLDLESQLVDTTYFVSITGKGNEDFSPVIPNTGSGAVSDGAYQLRINFDSKSIASLVDTSGIPIDGDGDGKAGGNFDFWFRSVPVSTGVASTSPKTIFVDKSYVGAVSNGSPAQPMKNLNFATWPANLVPIPGDVIRVVGANTATLTNVPAFEFGRGGVGNNILPDGLNLQVPKGVTMMVDAGAIFKMQGSQVSTGSATAAVDNSASHLQVLGIPGKPVFFTSYKDQSLGIDNDPLTTTPVAGDWGGINFRNSVDRSQGRQDFEAKGIFLNYVAGADIRFGGGVVTTLSPSPLVNPITMTESRPTILNNTISRSSDAAISADPNSFEETRFTTPIYQLAGNFEPDYSRVGPDIRGNTLTGNTTNGMQIRSTTVAGSDPVSMLVSGKFNDTDVVHVIAENLIVDNQPGGPIVEARGPDFSLVQLGQSVSTGSFTSGQVVRYRMTAIDRFGNSGPASTISNIVISGANNTVQLSGLPSANGDFLGRRLWRSINGGAFQLAAELDRSSSTYTDLGAVLPGTISGANPVAVSRARPNARLEIAPGTVVKLAGARIETSIGAQLIAEGTENKRVVFTSRADDKYGAGGSFDTGGDGTLTNPQAGDWGGLVARHLSTLSLDNSLVAFGGGVTSLPGGFAGFSAIEIHQSEARIANTRFESNASGLGGNLAGDRVGRGPNDASVIYVVGSQPAILDNSFFNNSIAGTAVISINANALTSDGFVDQGRQTGLNDRAEGSVANVGPLIRGNSMSNNGLNGLKIRGGELTTESIWDDADIVHILNSEIVVPDFHTYGGLTLRSQGDEGLVVKMSPGTGFTANGRPLDITDRIGGSLRIVGTPGFPVVLTSLNDDTVGAGNDIFGRPQLNTNNDTSVGRAGDWRSIRFDPYANDRNVSMLQEIEADQIQDEGTNDTVNAAQSLGALAATLSGGDENVRLGFSIDGAVAAPQDLDVYSFVATSGTAVWLDIDRTSGSLDTVVELLDAAGNILALSNNSLSESPVSGSQFVISDTSKILPTQVRGLDGNPFAPRNSWNSQTATDLYSTNPLDAGLQLTLPGQAGTSDTFYVRVRSSNLLATDATNLNARDANGVPTNKLLQPAQLRSGLTTGSYRLQVRMQQTDEVPGSVVQYADIRFATNGIEALGLPGSSPLLGQVAESGALTVLGNIVTSDRGSVTVAGSIGAQNQIDSYSFSVGRNGNINSGAHVSVTFDIDYADGFGRPDTTLWVFDANDNLVFTGTNSNIADDQAAPPTGNGLTDLTRGSAGTRDAFIGPVELPPGNYTVRVTNNSQVIQGIQETVFLRREPIDSVQRISVDRFDTTGSETAVAPVQVSFGTDLTNHRVEWNLSDVTTYVISQADAGNMRLSFANAMTGARTAEISQFPNVTDAALSPSGTLIASQAPPNITTDANTGVFVTLNTTGNIDPNSNVIPANAILATTNSGIQTFTAQITAAGPPATFAIQQRDQDGLIGGNTPQGDGMNFHALGYYTSAATLSLYGVATRGNGQNTFREGTIDGAGAVVGLGATSTVTTNIVYKLDPNTGAAINPTGVADRAGNNRTQGAGTNKVEFGRFITTGIVQGLAEIDGTLFAVSNQGELFSVANDNINAFGNVVSSATIIDPETGNAVVFNGLTRGPRNLQGGLFNNILFGTIADGTIYAFFTDGTLAPVFPGFSYKTQVANAFNGVTAIDFSALDVNLWHVSNLRSGDAGHGLVSNPTGSVSQTVSGGNSLYFGFRNNGTGQQGNFTGVLSTVANDQTYNTPGGAHGAILSAPINLTNYSPDDQPVLYFNYLLDTENQNANLDATALMRDAFRVYGADDDGNWILLATNNTAADNALNRTGSTDEFDTNINGNVDAYGNPVLTTAVVDAAGANSWRQARVPLAALAGKANVRLRFEFSTAATFETGNPLVGGIELTAVAGHRIVDGTGFTLTPNSLNGFNATNFEFDHGLVLAMPSGTSLVNNVSTLTVNGSVFTFSLTNASSGFIQYAVTDSPATIAQKVRTALLAFPALGLTAANFSIDPARANVFAISNLPTAGTYAVGGGLTAATAILGRPGVTAGAQSIPVTLEMTVENVHNAMRRSFAQAFSQTDMLNFFGVDIAALLWPSHLNSIVMLYKFDISNNNSAIGVTTSRAGDAFGVNKSNDAAHVDAKAANNNAFGVFVDDIVIGFAERGEQVFFDRGSNLRLNTPVTNNDYYQTLFGIAQPELGNYQLTVRTAADYGNSSSSTTLNLARASRSFDTNTRLAETLAIQVPSFAAGQIPDGATFTLSDGADTLTFEFEVNAGNDASAGFTAGNIPVRITNQSSATNIAAAIRDAINSTTVQSILSIKASIQGQVVGTTIGSTVELHGNVATNVNGGFAFPANTFLFPLVSGAETAFGEDLGDVERTRPQGQLLLVSNRISDSLNNGIVASAAAQNQGNAGPRPYPGAAINFPSTNPGGLAPGVVIMNNVFDTNTVAGIVVQDDASVTAPSPLARVVNNTFVGGQFGVQIVNAATPTILNNIFSRTGTAITNSASAVVGYNIYQGNGTPSIQAQVATEPFGVVLTTLEPLFANDAFYLAAGSKSIDSSIDLLIERDALSQVKGPLGLPTSSILAPDRDVAGQTRRDDPTVNDPVGTGSNPVKDRGAFERSDSDAPTAFILRPQDNDSLNNDLDRNVTYIRSLESNLNFFSILLQDSTGTGPDPATVVSGAVTLTENGRVLREGSDYVFGYNANSRTLRLTPLAGIWRNDSVYEITLNNKAGHRVIVPNGASLTDGNTIAITVGTTTTTIEFDSNSTFTVGNIQIPFSSAVSNPSSPYELAALISEKLNAAGISSRLEGDGSLFVTGASSVVSTSTAITSVRAIQDLAGNALAANRPTSLTQFTIVMPEATLDYGDSSGARIPTIESATATNGNGSRHVILPVDYPRLVLGSWVDANGDGLPSAAADGDDSDVVVDFGTLGGVTQGTAGPARLQMPDASAIDGQTVSITDKILPLIFEFDTDGSGTPSGDRIIITLNSTDSATTVASSLAAAVRQAMLDAKIAGVTPIASGNIVSLGGSSNHQFALAAPSSVPAAQRIVRLKQGNVDMVIPTSLASLSDGQTMTITDSRGRTVTFELDTGVPAGVAIGQVSVTVDLSTATPGSVAQAFVVAINTQVAAGNLSISRATLFGTSTVRIVGDDEDGVVFDGLFNAGSPAVKATVTATDFGMLDVWVDWNNDGDFADANETVLTASKRVQPGVNEVSIQTPATAVNGFTTARFRLSTLGGLLSNGIGVGGEVEDYLIEIAPGRPPITMNDTYTVNEDLMPTVAPHIGVLANDDDADNIKPLPGNVPGVNIFVHDKDPTTAQIEPEVNVQNGTLVLNRDGTFTYTPFLDFNGVDTFTYRATDGRLLSAPAVVSITVTARNDAPDANADTLNISEDEVVSLPGITFTANDFAHFRMEGSSTGFHTNESGQALTVTNVRVLAEATTSFGVAATTVRFASRPGQGLLGTEVVFNAADLGTISSVPQVTVLGDRIQVTLNSNALAESTIDNVLSAIIGNAAANGRIEASIILGSGTTKIGSLSSAPGSLVLPPSGGTASVLNNVLSYTPPAHYNNLIGGPVKLLLTISDDNTAGDPNPLTATSTLTINIAELNDAPVFTVPEPVVNRPEDPNGTGIVIIPGFATGIFSGPDKALDELGLTGLPAQTFAFQIFSNSNRNLFAKDANDQPILSIATDGTLNFQTAPNANGQAIIVARLRDSGLATGGNVNVSADRTFTINVGAVNDAPEYQILNPIVSSREDQGLVQVANFLTGIRPGPLSALDEAGQAVNVTVEALVPGNFTVQPSIGADGRLIFQTGPDVNMDNADLRVRVILTDNGPAGSPNVNSVEQIFAIETAPVNDAPSFAITNRNVRVNEDVGPYREVMINAMTTGPATATDEVNQTLTFTVISVSAPELFSQQPNIVRVGSTATAELRFTPALHKNGSAIVVVRLEDGGSATAPNVNASALQTFTITIDPINDAPDFTIPGGIDVLEDEGLKSVNEFAKSVRRGPVGADDENSQVLQFIVTPVDPSAFTPAGQPRIAVDGTLVFQVVENVNRLNAATDNRSLAVVVELRDNGDSAPPLHQNTSVKKTFIVNVNPTNDPPQSVDFVAQTSEDIALDLLANSVLVNAVGGPTSDELNQVVFMSQVERTSLRGGKVEPTFDSNNRIVSLRYTPPLNAVGSDSFIYVITDNGSPSMSGTATVSVNIIPRNDAPQFKIGDPHSSIEDAGGVTVNNWVTEILAGPPESTDEHASQTVSFEVTVDNPSLFLIQPTIDGTGTLFYQTAPDANGSSVIRVVAVDSGSGVSPNVNRSLEQSATIEVVALNDAPVFTAGGNVSVQEDSGLHLSNWATDIRPAAGLLAQPPRALDEESQIVDFSVIVDRPELFSVQPVVSSTGQLSFTTKQDAFGQAVLTIRAVDRGPGTGLNVNTSEPATITINISEVNDRPVARNDNYVTSENSVLSVAATGLLANDTDSDVPNDTIRAVAASVVSSLGAQVTINSDGSFTYDPSGVLEIQRMFAESQFRIDTFTYTARDNANTLSDLAVVTVRVTGVNDAPVAVNDQFSIGVGQTRLLDILGNDTDIDSAIDGRTIQITQVPVFGSVAVNQTGVVQYVAGAGFRGSDTFAYVVRDALGALSNEATVAVVVNNAPVANPDVTFTYKNQAIVIPVLSNDSDLDGTLDRTSIEIVVEPSPSGVATPNDDGTITFTPATNFSGEVTFSYVVSDDTGTTSNVAQTRVRVLNSLWQNPTLNLDVNNDGRVTALDALVVISYLNNRTFRRILPGSGFVPPPFIDVDGNERLAAQDVLAIISYLNSRSRGGGGVSEGEGEGPATGGFDYAMMVTPQQMVDTVGAAVVRDVERLLSQFREEALLEATESIGGPVIACTPAMLDDEVVAAFSASKEKSANSSDGREEDEFFAQLGPKFI